MTTYTLTTGITIESSNRRSNRTGYTGAALSPAWTLDADKPFIAACSNPTDSAIMAQMRHRERTAWHGGSYSDAREAAYVVGMFKADPVGTDREIARHGAIDKFPADLYTLPSGLEYEKAIEMLSAKKKLKSVKVKVVKADSTAPASGNLGSFFARDILVSIARDKGGPEAFQAYIKGKTIAEFAKENGLTV